MDNLKIAKQILKLARSLVAEESYDERRVIERLRREEILRTLKPDLIRAKQFLRQSNADLKSEYADEIDNGWFLPFQFNGKDLVFKVDVCSPGIVRYQILDQSNHAIGMWYDFAKLAAEFEKLDFSKV